MRVAGEKSKQRVKEKLSQAELAKEFVHKQQLVTLKTKMCDSLDIFSSVCLRLDLQVEECIEGSSEKTRKLIKKVEELCFTLSTMKPMIC